MMYFQDSAPSQKFEALFTNSIEFGVCIRNDIHKHYVVVTTNPYPNSNGGLIYRVCYTPKRNSGCDYLSMPIYQLIPFVRVPCRRFGSAAKYKFWHINDSQFELISK